MFSIEEIVSLLYGELEEAAMQKRKEYMSKILSAGKTKGEWQRVPGKVGFYTADLKDLSEAERQESQLGLFPNQVVG
jgi:hypothetical protein